MVCTRCKMIVKSELENLGLHPISVELGSASIRENLTTTDKKALNDRLTPYGFELISKREGQLIEKIKNVVIEAIHYAPEPIGMTFSAYLSQKLHHDYSYMSKLFSESENITLEQYIIAQKVERIKELLAYDELSISEIANNMNYSSNGHLSRQFKSVTGFTPSEYKKLKYHNRKSLEEI